GELLVADPLESGLDLVSGEALLEEVAAAAIEGALGRAVVTRHRGHGPVLVLTLERGHDRGDRVRGTDAHADLAGAGVGQQVRPGEQLLRTHAVVGEPHALKVGQNALALGGVDRCGLAVGGHVGTTARVDLSGEVPTTGVAGTVVRVAGDAAAERGDLL